MGQISKVRQAAIESLMAQKFDGRDAASFVCEAISEDKYLNELVANIHTAFSFDGVDATGEPETRITDIRAAVIGHQVYAACVMYANRCVTEGEVDRAEADMYADARDAA